MLEDKYQFHPTPPYIPGGEAAGVVAVVGNGVSGWSVGDRVVGGLGTTGGYAELLAIPAATARLLPDSVDFAVATGMNYAYGTTLYALRHRANVQPAETMLVLGAGGALGVSAVEIGKLMGARVIAAASTEEKLDLCRERGADETINGRLPRRRQNGYSGRVLLPEVAAGPSPFRVKLWLFWLACTLAQHPRQVHR